MSPVPSLPIPNLPPWGCPRATPQYWHHLTECIMLVPWVEHPPSHWCLYSPAVYPPTARLWFGDWPSLIAYLHKNSAAEFWGSTFKLAKNKQKHLALLYLRLRESSWLSGFRLFFLPRLSNFWGNWPKKPTIPQADSSQKRQSFDTFVSGQLMP